MQHLLSDIPWVILQTLSAAIEAIFLVRQYTSTRSSGGRYQRENPADRNLDFQSRNKSYYSAVKHVIYSTLFKSSRIIKRAVAYSNIRFHAVKRQF